MIRDFTRVAQEHRLHLALKSWGGTPPAGWRWRVWLAQEALGIPADGLWGPQCAAAGIPRPDGSAEAEDALVVLGAQAVAAGLKVRFRITKEGLEMTMGAVTKTTNQDTVEEGRCLK